VPARNSFGNLIYASGCDRDEWPPALFQQGRPDGWIRYLPAYENRGAANKGGSGWRGFCKFPPNKSVAPPQGGTIANGVAEVVVTTFVTLNVMSYTWTNVRFDASDPAGLTSNVCRPSVLTADAGYALLTNDPWYGKVTITNYNFSPGARAQGVIPPAYKRDEGPVEALEYLDGKMVFDNGNSSRLASDEELEDLGYTRCETEDCQEELRILDQQQAELDPSTQPLPTVPASVSTVEVQYTSMANYQQPGSKAFEQASEPTATPSTKLSGDHVRHHRHGHRHRH
jgi:hypothetical protein